jgi:predicted ATPase
LITDEEERSVLAELLLQSGNAAITQSSFALAASHLQLGISMLGRRHWQDHYHLSLNLYDAAAEVENCNGNFEEAERLVKEVMDNSRNQSDKSRAIVQGIYSLGCCKKFHEATLFGRDVLRTIGFLLPQSSSFATMLYEWFKLKRRLNRLSDQDILSLPLMHDSNAQVAMQVLTFMMLYAMMDEPALSAIIIVRRVQITLQYGLGNMAPIAFSNVAMMMATYMKDVPGGLRLASLSLEMQKQYGNPVWLP